MTARYLTTYLHRRDVEKCRGPGVGARATPSCLSMRRKALTVKVCDNLIKYTNIINPTYFERRAFPVNCQGIAVAREVKRGLEWPSQSQSEERN